MALLYENEAEYLTELSEFVGSALDCDEPVMVAVPSSSIGPLREALAAYADRVAFADMTEVGRNPGAVISIIQTFADGHRGRRVSYVGEPAWPGRSPAELVETAKHEALINLAFAGDPLTVLCPYHAADLPADVLTFAEQTHPQLVKAGQRAASPAYLGLGGIPPRCLEPLPDPPASAEVLAYHADLRPVRTLVGRNAAVAGLSPERVADVVIAVSELAANTLAHTAAGGRLRIWQTGEELVCEIGDRGWITDPLAGRVRPPGDQLGGYGLWLVNQVCDLVEIRTGPAEGTNVRVHMSLCAGARAW